MAGAIPMSEALIRRLQGRIRSEPTVDMAICPPIRPRPPVSDVTLADAETRLGFPLPPLVRALYTQVGDGGYGPGYGVNRLVGTPSEYSLVVGREQMNEQSQRHPGNPWPERLVELVNWGCNLFSGIDCAQPSSPVFFYDNDRAAEVERLTDLLLPEADSLEGWLSAWLAGENLWTAITRLRRNFANRLAHENREHRWRTI